MAGITRLRQVSRAAQPLLHAAAAPRPVLALLGSSGRSSACQACQGLAAFWRQTVTADAFCGAVPETRGSPIDIVINPAGDEIRSIKRSGPPQICAGQTSLDGLVASLQCVKWHAARRRTALHAACLNNQSSTHQMRSI